MGPGLALVLGILSGGVGVRGRIQFLQKIGVVGGGGGACAHYMPPLDLDLTLPGSKVKMQSERGQGCC
jgi:hypothetical protein